jgi:peptidoglycan/xylan/chitin deacetylase (PgdA/CDA1 family)
MYKKTLVVVALLAATMLSAGCEEFPLFNLFFPGSPAQPPSESGPLVNIQIDAEGQDVVGFTDMMNELKARNLKATIFVTGDFANREAFLIYGYSQDGYEIAMHGYNTGEQLATMSYDAQKALLSSAKTAVEGCVSCGISTTVAGFRPQFFSQNEDTYRIMDEWGMKYNSGFKAGLLYAEGHELDARPYRVEGHQFYAVPISTVEYGGKRIYLCDMSCANADKLTAEQWSEALRMGLEQAKANDEPFVVLLHGIITGDRAKYTYWQPFIDFIDDVAAEAQTVTTSELVDHYAGE